MGIADQLPKGAMHGMAYDIVTFVHLWPRLESSRDLGTREAEQYRELPFWKEGTLDRSAETIPDDLPVFLGAVLERHERARLIENICKVTLPLGRPEGSPQIR
jgi:hypothetical protein